MITKVFGTGGIGTGIFFQLEDNRPISREESRAAVLTNFKDYCKGHIIMHYVSVLSPDTHVYMLGMAGRDEPGKNLLTEMQSAGIDTRYVQLVDEAPTMFSVCYQFADSAGGNITSSNSACGLVTPAYIECCGHEIDAESIVLAAPEVPLESRIRLLEIGRARGAFTIASFLSAEAKNFAQAGGFALSDLISINVDEALSVCDDGINAAAEVIAAANPFIKLAITEGKSGIHLFENKTRAHIPCFPVNVVSAAGAGDAFLGGLIAATIAGKDFVDAATYGAVAARFAVSCANTIAETVRPETLANFIANL